MVVGVGAKVPLGRVGHLCNHAGPHAWDSDPAGCVFGGLSAAGDTLVQNDDDQRLPARCQATSLAASSAAFVAPQLPRSHHLPPSRLGSSSALHCCSPHHQGGPFCGTVSHGCVRLGVAKCVRRAVGHLSRQGAGCLDGRGFAAGPPTKSVGHCSGCWRRSMATLVHHQGEFRAVRVHRTWGAGIEVDSCQVVEAGLGLPDVGVGQADGVARVVA